MQPFLTLVEALAFLAVVLAPPTLVAVGVYGLWSLVRSLFPDAWRDDPGDDEPAAKDRQQYCSRAPKYDPYDAEARREVEE